MWPFKKKPKVKIGQVWQYHRTAKDPFMDATITIIAIKQGYAQYQYSGGGTCSDTIANIMTFYKFVEEAPDADKS